MYITTTICHKTTTTTTTAATKTTTATKVIIATTTYYSNIVLPEPSHHSLSTQLSLSLSVNLAKYMCLYTILHTRVCVCMCSIYAYTIFCLYNSIFKINPSSKFNFVLWCTTTTSTTAVTTTTTTWYLAPFISPFASHLLQTKVFKLNKKFLLSHQIQLMPANKNNNSK